MCALGTYDLLLAYMVVAHFQVGCLVALMIRLIYILAAGSLVILVADLLPRAVRPAEAAHSQVN